MFLASRQVTSASGSIVTETRRPRDVGSPLNIRHNVAEAANVKRASNGRSLRSWPQRALGLLETIGKREVPSVHGGKKHGGKYRFLSFRRDRSWNRLYRQPISIGPFISASGYGVPAGTEPHSRAYLSAKGIRDIASGLFAAMLIAYGSAHALGWFMLIAPIIPIGDAAIVLQQGGRRAVAFGVHGGTAGAMVIISGLLLFD
jgi:hypothetical protein